MRHGGLGSRTLWLLAAVLCLIALLPGEAVAQEPLRIATKESPPFAMREADGSWTGISIELWAEIAARLELDYRLVDGATPEAMLAGVAAGDYDLAISALSVTAEREERVDFSHPYYSTGLGVAVSGQGGDGVERILRGLFSWPMLTLIGSVLLALIGAGYAFWILERKKNAQFARHRQGVSQGLWWSTIMLLGHKGVFPVSVMGRVLAVTSMLVSILLLSVLTGAIASALTVGHFESVIRDQNDLRHVGTLAVEGTAGAEFLRRERIAFRAVPSVAAGLDALAAEEEGADALVHDAPLLEWEVGRRRGGVEVLQRVFELQDYAIAMAPGSALRERINTALLSLKASARWKAILFRYLRSED